MKVVKIFFVIYDISVSTDGTEDGEIHCLKVNRIAAVTRPTIEQVTAVLLAPHAGRDKSDSNPFVDLDNEEDDNGIACNEIVVEDC